MARDKSPPTAAPIVTTVSVAEETLEATPARVLTFLRAVGTSDPIRFALSGVGYDDAEHARGWSLLHSAAGFTPPATAAPSPDGEVVAAIAALDASDERLHRIVDASLRHHYPALRDQLIADLKPGRGGESVLYVGTLLARLAKLSGPDGKAALERLARRSLTPTYRADLAALVKTAERFTTPTAAPATDSSQHDALRALRAWFEEWSELARGEVSRKDYLLRLGLARRKRSARPDARRPPASEPAKP